MTPSSIPRRRLDESSRGARRLEGHLRRRRNFMIRVLLLHGGQVPHYRVPVYNHLSRYLRERSFALTVISEGIQPGNPTAIEFDYAQLHLSIGSIARMV